MVTAPAQSLPRRRRINATAGLFTLFLAVFTASPVTMSWDSVLSIYTAVSFLHGHASELSEFMPIVEKLQRLDYHEGKPYSEYPIGPSLLAAPVVGVYLTIHPQLIDELQERPAKYLEKFIASFIGAAAGAVFFWVILSQFDSIPVAISAAMIFSFCTSMWSLATRALWQHGPLVLMLSVAMLLLTRARRRPGLVQYVGLPLAMAFLMRPTAGLPIAIISLYVLIRHSAFFLKYLGLAAVIAIPWLAFNWWVHRSLLPEYYMNGTLSLFSDRSSFWDGLSGTLFSPARGLFMYSPVLFFALSGFALALRDREQR